MEIKQVDSLPSDERYAFLVRQLWPHCSFEEANETIEECVQKGAMFVAQENGQAIGFAQISLRHDYVEGTSSSPVGYLEGIFVLPQFRNRGIATQLLSASKEWAKQNGCREFASDTPIENAASQAFHKQVGFLQANVCVHFVMTV